MDNNLKAKKEHLISILKGYGSLLVAYSGGVDSTFLVATAHEALKKNLVAITAKSPLHPVRENQQAKAFAQKLGIIHLFVKSKEMSWSDFTANTRKDVICVKNIFLKIC